MQSRHSRREFMGVVAGGSAVLMSAPWFGHTAFAAESADPDLVVFNARVYTGDPLMPRAELLRSRPGGSPRSDRARRSSRLPVDDGRGPTTLSR